MTSAMPSQDFLAHTIIMGKLHVILEGGKDSSLSWNDYVKLADWHYMAGRESKLANLVYAREIARRFPTITTVSVHPGVVKTDLVNNLSVARKAVVYVSQYVQGVSLMEEWQGCLNQLWAAAGATKEELLNGAFYRPVGALSNDMLDKMAKDSELANKLWSWTEEVLTKY
jgi:NAD(P)-dependent dehydrogenase (short-subunit alcohol dehydrogenase family)